MISLQQIILPINHSQDDLWKKIAEKIIACWNGLL